MFSKEMAAAYSSCVGALHAIPVRGKPHAKHPAYVLEIDITPKYALAKDIIFSYRDIGSKRATYIMVGKRVLAATDPEADSLEETVKANSQRRLREDLERTRTDLEQGLEAMDDETAASFKTAIAKIDHETKSQWLFPEALEQVLKMKAIVSPALHAINIPAVGIMLALAGINDKFTENIVHLRRQIKEMDRYCNIATAGYFTAFSFI